MRLVPAKKWMTDIHAVLHLFVVLNTSTVILLLLLFLNQYAVSDGFMVSRVAGD